MNDVNFLLKRRENEKSSSKACNHQLQQDDISKGGMMPLSISKHGDIAENRGNSQGQSEHRAHSLKKAQTQGLAGALIQQTWTLC